jgi:hypothetical protein
MWLQNGQPTTQGSSSSKERAHRHQHHRRARVRTGKKQRAQKKSHIELRVGWLFGLKRKEQCAENHLSKLLFCLEKKAKQTLRLSLVRQA